MIRSTFKNALAQLLGRDALLLTASFVFAQLLYVVGLVFVAQWVPPEELGTYALFISYCAFFTVTGAWAIENAFFVCQPGRDRQSIWDVALFACVANSLAAALVYWGFVARWIELPAPISFFIPVYVFAQCQVSVLLADHFSRGGVRVVARNRVFRVLLTVSIWLACVVFPTAQADMVLITGVIVGAVVSMLRLYPTSSRKGGVGKSTLVERIKTLQVYRRYPLAEAPALFLSALSGHGIILLTGICFGPELAGLIGMAILAITKPAGLIAQSIGRMAQADFAHTLRNQDYAGARRILMQTLVVLCIWAFGGAALIWTLAPYAISRFMSANWAGLADLVVMFIPALIAMVLIHPMILFLSVSAKQKIIFIQELTISICPLIGFGLACAISGMWITTITAYIITLTLLYVVFFPIVIYALYSIGTDQVPSSALRERR